jgi:2-keto-4-pentenoate hydratase/2-oxohepta-3-ene-1,7-dioic acid hydratase in catechol pathway
MKLARIQRSSPSGPTPRVVVLDLRRGVAIDLQHAERLRREVAGDSPEAAARLAAAHLPDSLAAALGSQTFRDDAERAVAGGAPAAATVALSEVVWLAPIDPPRYRDFMTFEQHHLTARHVLGRPVPPVTYELPTYYKGGHLTLTAHEQPVARPSYTKWLDFELELGWVVGRAGIDLTPGEAALCLFGVCLLNDLSARDRQFHETQGNLGPAKGKDFATAVGPWIATVDELELDAIDLRATVNGEEWAAGSSGSAMWSAAEVLAYLSTSEPLVPGELVGSGTLGGGCGLETGRLLVPGDVVELSGEGLGTLRTPIVDGGAPRWVPPPRRPGRTIDGGVVEGLAPALPPRSDAPAPPVDRHRT